MTHGDLTPGNVLVASGRLAGVLDVGSFGAADPALDLISAWNLLAAGPRLALRDALRCTDLEWERSRAWAFQQAMGLVWYYAESNPVMAGSAGSPWTASRAAAEPSQAGGPASIRRRTSASPSGPRSMLHQLSTHQVAPAAAQDAGSGGSSWTNSPVLSASSTTS